MNQAYVDEVKQDVDGFKYIEATPCYYCVFWTNAHNCPIKTFNSLDEIKNTVMCSIGELVDDEQDEQPPYILVTVPT
jgi:hypothetical protein